MKNFILTLVAALISLSLSAQQQNGRQGKDELKEYFFVMLKKGPTRNQPKAVADSIQKAHLAHISKMGESGKLNIAGPFGDDGEWRGILIFNTKTAEEARALVEEDPAVKAGRLVYEIHPWWSMRGAKLD